ncbi:MAG TPA: ABC transporter permease [Gemmatimonadales bacterium]
MRRLLFGKQLRRLGWKPGVQAEVEDELSHHLELMISEAMQRGLSREEAEAQARLRFGADAAVRAACEELARSRDRSGDRLALLADLRDDLRWAVRSLRRSPAYTLSSGLTLALVVAANALVFTLAYGILFRPLPYPDSGRLVALNERIRAGDVWEVSVPNLEALQSQSRSFAGLAGWYGSEATLVSEDTPRVSLGLVTAEFFPTLGTPAAMGRTLTAADQQSAEGRPVVLSHAAWQTHFGGDLAILGRAITLNTEQLTVVGVMPASFRFPTPDVAAWAPWGPIQPWMRNRSVHIMQVVGRLRPEVSLAAAATELATIMQRVQAEHPGEDPAHTVLVRDLKTTLTGNARLTLLLLLGSVGAVLLLACANLAGLTVTRASQREGEFAMRAALGASRWRLIRQLVVESTLLALVAGGVGIGCAAGLVTPMLGFLPAAVPRPGPIGLDLTVVAVTLVVAGSAGVIIGVIAAIRAARHDPALRLRTTGQAATASVSRLRLQRGLVATQMALSVVLLAGAGLLLQSFREVLRIDPGYRTDSTLTAMVSLPSSRYSPSQVIRWYQDLPARLERISGVVSASAVSSLPVSGGLAQGDLTLEDQAFAPGQAPAVSYRRVLPNYFRTMGIPLIRGREFTDQDRGEGAMVVVVGQSLADRFWPNQDPVGKRIKVGPPGGEPWLTIVGVVGDARYDQLEQPPRLDTYEPHAQRPRGTMGVVVRTAGDPLGLADAVRSGLREGDPVLPVWNVQSMDDRVSGSLDGRRFTTSILTGFGVAALLLAAIGIYGVSAYSVGRRRREFAIRLALGARPATVQRQVLRESLRVAGLGIMLGLPAGIVLTRMIRALLFDVSPSDPRIFGSAILLLGAAVLAATWLPARSATRTDPVTALRE